MSQMKFIIAFAALAAMPLAAGAATVAKIGTNDYETVEAAVAAATDGDVVTITADTTWGAADLTLPAKQFAIDGQGHTLTRTSAARLLAQKGTVVGITNVVFNGGGEAYTNSAVQGSALYIASGATVTLGAGAVVEDYIFSGGPVNSKHCGGTVYNQGGTLILDGGTIRDNAVYITTCANGWYTGGAGVFNLSGNFYFKSGLIENNLVKSLASGQYNPAGAGVLNLGMFYMGEEGETDNTKAIIRGNKMLANLSSHSAVSGGGVAVVVNGQMYFYSGKITQNLVLGDSKNYCGAGIATATANSSSGNTKLYLYGGEVSNNTNGWDGASEYYVPANVVVGGGITHREASVFIHGSPIVTGNVAVTNATTGATAPREFLHGSNNTTLILDGKLETEILLSHYNANYYAVGYQIGRFAPIDDSVTVANCGAEKLVSIDNPARHGDACGDYIYFNEDGSTAVCETSRREYPLLQMGLNDLCDGETLTLLTDISDNTIYTFTRAVKATFDLDGHTISRTGQNDIIQPNAAASDFTIKNGTLVGCNYTVILNKAGTNRLENLVIQQKANTKSVGYYQFDTTAVGFISNVTFSCEYPLAMRAGQQTPIEVWDSYFGSTNYFHYNTSSYQCDPIYLVVHSAKSNHVIADQFCEGGLVCAENPDSDSDLYAYKLVARGFPGAGHTGAPWEPVSADDLAWVTARAVAKIGNGYYERLRDAALDAEEGETIELLCDQVISNKVNFYNAANVVLDGRGYTVTRGPLELESSIALANTADGMLTVRNVNFVGDLTLSSHPGYGECFYLNSYSGLTVEETVTFRDFYAKSNGGAIMVCSNARLNFYGVVTDSSAGTSGGAIVSQGVLVFGGVISNCWAGSWGGAVYPHGGTMTMTGGVITCNGAKQGGGGIHVQTMFYISGDAKIFGNTGVTYGVECDVTTHNWANGYIHLAGDFTGTAGVYNYNNGVAGKQFGVMDGDFSGITNFFNNLDPSLEAFRLDSSMWWSTPSDDRETQALSAGAVARIEDRYYSSFNNANDALQTNDTVYILRDCSAGGSRFTFKCTATWDLQGHCISCGNSQMFPGSNGLLTMKNGHINHTASQFQIFGSYPFYMENMYFTDSWNWGGGSAHYLMGICNPAVFVNCTNTFNRIAYHNQSNIILTNCVDYSDNIANHTTIYSGRFKTNPANAWCATLCDRCMVIYTNADTNAPWEVVHAYNGEGVAGDPYVVDFPHDDTTNVVIGISKARNGDNFYSQLPYAVADAADQQISLVMKSTTWDGVSYQSGDRVIRCGASTSVVARIDRDFYTRLYNPFSNPLTAGDIWLLRSVALDDGAIEFNDAQTLYSESGANYSIHPADGFTDTAAFRLGASADFTLGDVAIYDFSTGVVCAAGSRFTPDGETEITENAVNVHIADTNAIGYVSGFTGRIGVRQEDAARGVSFGASVTGETKSADLSENFYCDNDGWLLGKLKKGRLIWWFDDDIGTGDDPRTGDGIPDRFQKLIKLSVWGGLWDDTLDALPRYGCVTFYDENDKETDAETASASVPAAILAATAGNHPNAGAFTTGGAWYPVPPATATVYKGGSGDFIFSYNHVVTTENGRRGDTETVTPVLGSRLDRGGEEIAALEDPIAWAWFMIEGAQPAALPDGVVFEDDRYVIKRVSESGGVTFDFAELKDFAITDSTIHFIAGEYPAERLEVGAETPSLVFVADGEVTLKAIGSDSLWRLRSDDEHEFTFKGLEMVGSTASAAPDFGGAIEAQGVSLVIDGCRFADFTAANGGAISTMYIDSGYPATQLLTVTNTTFAANAADNCGGAIYADGSVVLEAGTVFEDNFALVCGGAVYLSSALGREQRLAATRTAFLRNSAETDVESYSCYGGAVYVADGSAEIHACLFGQDEAEAGRASWGGAIELDGCEGYVSQIADSTFRGNTGFAIDAYKTDVVIKNSLIVDNFGEDVNMCGGAISMDRSAFGATDFEDATNVTLGVVFSGRTAAVYTDADSLKLKADTFNPLAAYGDPDAATEGRCDFDGVAYGSRPYGVSIGAYETAAMPTSIVRKFVNPGESRVTDEFAWTGAEVAPTNCFVLKLDDYDYELEYSKVGFSNNIETTSNAQFVVDMNIPGLCFTNYFTITAYTEDRYCEDEYCGTVKTGSLSCSNATAVVAFTNLVHFTADPVLSTLGGAVRPGGSAEGDLRLVVYGGVDDTGPDLRSDGIPDCYQKTIVFKVVNGSWAGGLGAEDVVRCFLLTDEDGVRCKNGTAQFAAGDIPTPGAAVGAPYVDDISKGRWYPATPTVATAINRYTLGKFIFAFAHTAASGDRRGETSVIVEPDFAENAQITAFALTDGKIAGQLRYVISVDGVETEVGDYANRTITIEGVEVLNADWETVGAAQTDGEGYWELPLPQGKRFFRAEVMGD